MTYSPRIYPQLVSALYHTSRDRRLRMTTLVNGFVYRGLHCEMLPPEAWKALPNEEDFSFGPSLGLDGKVAAHEKGYLCPAEMDEVLDREATPFQSMVELEAWYGSALEGIARAWASARHSQRPGRKLKPWEQNIDWKYHTATMMLNRLYVDGLTELAVRQTHVPHEKKDPIEDVWT